ncbi:MAG: KH domain-containing protein [Chloroflexi bacterium]|nr:KH domain-containing protein [Chloroflexota bacterium]MDQ3399493.1 KH domain-containing protein [Chloroflexota bacterium]
MTREGILVDHVAKQLVDDPASVVVTETRVGDFLKLHLAVGEPDVGKVIGRGGRIAKAIRTLLKVMATRDGSKVSLDID